jgi:hypothetical protein
MPIDIHLSQADPFSLVPTFKSLKLLNFDFKVDTDPDFHYNLDPDPASQNNMDPDTQTYNLKQVIFILSPEGHLRCTVPV